MSNKGPVYERSISWIGQLLIVRQMPLTGQMAGSYCPVVVARQPLVEGEVALIGNDRD